jgi:hypothetical protein
MENNKVLTLILGAGWAVCEILNAIPTVKSNSVFELIYNTLKSVTGN